MLANTENSVDGLEVLEDETFLCPSEVGYIRPLRAINSEGHWRIVVNNVKAHYEQLSQTARVEQCLAPGAGEDGRVCSGHGVCECGECDCDDGWQGEHCHHCPTCLDTCHLLAPCVECLQWGSGLLLDDWDTSTISNTTNHHNPQACLEACQLRITSYEAHSFNEESLENLGRSWYDCSHRNGSNCKYTFLYQEIGHQSDQVQILFNRDSVVCPEQPDYLAWIIGK